MAKDHQHLLPVAEAVERLTGKRPHPSTCWRWTRKGIRGIRLKTVMLGGKPRTKVAWVHEFIEELTGSDPPGPAPLAA